MIRRLMRRLRRREPSLSDALRRAIAAENARTGSPAVGDLGDLLSGRLALPPAGPAPALDNCWCDVNRLMRSDEVTDRVDRAAADLLRRPLPPPLARAAEARLWVALIADLTDVDRTGDQLVPLYLEDPT